MKPKRHQLVRWMIGAALGILFCARGVPAQSDRIGVPTVRVNADTIWIVVGGERFPGDLHNLSSPDTTGFGTSAPISVIGSNDTLLVTLGTEPFEFLILWKEDTIREVFEFRGDPDSAAYPPRVELLRQYSQFGSTVPAHLSPFNYRSQSDSVLSLIRHEFNLDSLAGTGSDVSRTLRLMHWLHQSARWDGSRENPAAQNSYDLLLACARNGHTANCGGMAQMFTAMLLAEGIKARQLVCLPYDTADQECHSVNIAFSAEQKKWILVDPTHDACFQDAQGEYLGPLEIRQAMVNGDSIVVPADINVNGVADSRMSYLGYLAKNLFRFSSFQDASPRDSISHFRWSRIFLSPTGYRPDLPGTVDSTSSSYLEFYTDDVSHFLGLPK
jgi:hypothetical protein